MTAYDPELAALIAAAGAMRDSAAELLADLEAGEEVDTDAALVVPLAALDKALEPYE